MRWSVKIARVAGTEIRLHTTFLLGSEAVLRSRLAERRVCVDFTQRARRHLLEGTIHDGQLVRIDYDRDVNRFAFTAPAAPATEPEVVAAR
jgi:hypothetical protein